MRPPMYDEWAAQDTWRREAERQAEEREVEKQVVKGQAAEGQADAVSVAYGSSAYGRLMADHPLEQPTLPCPLESLIARFPFVSGDTVPDVDHPVASIKLALHVASPPSSPPRPRGAMPPGFSWAQFPSMPPVQLLQAAAESISSSGTNGALNLSGSLTMHSGNEVHHSGKKRLLLDNAPATSPPQHFKRLGSRRTVEEQCSNMVS